MVRVRKRVRVRVRKRVRVRVRKRVSVQGSENQTPTLTLPKIK